MTWLNNIVLRLLLCPKWTLTIKTTESFVSEEKAVKATWWQNTYDLLNRIIWHPLVSRLISSNFALVWTTIPSIKKYFQTFVSPSAVGANVRRQHSAAILEFPVQQLLLRWASVCLGLVSAVIAPPWQRISGIWWSFVYSENLNVSLWGPLTFNMWRDTC